MVTVHNFSYGLVNPVLGYAMSCLGAFLGLRCVTRARAHTGTARAGWLVLAAISLGAAGSINLDSTVGATLGLGTASTATAPVTSIGSIDISAGGNILFDQGDWTSSEGDLALTAGTGVIATMRRIRPGASTATRWMNLPPMECPTRLTSP